MTPVGSPLTPMASLKSDVVLAELFANERAQVSAYVAGTWDQLDREGKRWATSMHFLRAFTSVLQEQNEELWGAIHHHATAFCNLAWEDYEYAKWRPSLVAASVLLVARRVLCLPVEWPSQYAQATTYSLPDLMDCSFHLFEKHVKLFPSYMREEENCRFVNGLDEAERMRPAFHQLYAPYAERRKELIESLQEAAEWADYSAGGLFLAVELMDAVFSTTKPKRIDLALMSIACLCLAHKVMERDSKESCPFDLSAWSKKALTQMERWVLKQVDWEVHRVTALHFMHAYIDRLPVVGSEEEELRKFGGYFCYLALGHERLMECPKDLAAASALFCARRQLKCTPRWPDVWAQRTGFPLDAIKSTAEVLWSLNLSQ